ncbi:ABC transporter substrate-binding protein [Actinokineospora cianjurensis]|uniref:Amino acid/amide ABC transporter substrate-binding protein (HAAT family) n=1 Tax=Actinokineospora cianjurensis TaxID=585224 RepID=A0A421B3P4_9PSEU|nr:ABC transporter substrate-binding protein [Actinokineospora cianjurensis]RLK58910.1 amino acid/amide ABC transporter substrate-binding protein (HAAT family) [Actinokineospora cianjurensis]
MISRRGLFTAAAGVGATAVLASCGRLSGEQAAAAPAPAAGPIFFGVSAPLSGASAEYGKIWRTGFDLALDEINGAGGVKGREIELLWEDTQSDQKQSVPVAQKFAGDSRVLAELGDFASPASMAASPVYEKAHLVQFGFTNSHPDFTKGGEYMWSTSTTQQDHAPELADLAKSLGTKQAVYYINTDWGKTTWKLYEEHAKKSGYEIVHSEAVQADGSDFRPSLISGRDKGADVLVFIAYYQAAALLTQQAKNVGLGQAKIALPSSAYSPQYIALGGEATEGSQLIVRFHPGDTRPQVREFVDKYQKRYGKQPDDFGAGAYDALKILAWAVEHSDGTREGVRKALLEGKDIPSLLYGPFAFREDRRVTTPKSTRLVVKGGAFTLAGA